MAAWTATDLAAAIGAVYRLACHWAYEPGALRDPEIVALCQAVRALTTRRRRLTDLTDEHLASFYAGLGCLVTDSALWQQVSAGNGSLDRAACRRVFEAFQSRLEVA